MPLSSCRFRLHFRFIDDFRRFRFSVAAFCRQRAFAAFRCRKAAAAAAIRLPPEAFRLLAGLPFHCGATRQIFRADALFLFAFAAIFIILMLRQISPLLSLLSLSSLFDIFAFHAEIAAPLIYILFTPDTLRFSFDAASLRRRSRFSTALHYARCRCFAAASSARRRRIAFID